MCVTFTFFTTTHNFFEKYSNPGFLTRVHQWMRNSSLKMNQITSDQISQQQKIDELDVKLWRIFHPSMFTSFLSNLFFNLSFEASIVVSTNERIGSILMLNRNVNWGQLLDVSKSKSFWIYFYKCWGKFTSFPCLTR